MVVYARKAFQAVEQFHFVTFLLLQLSEDCNQVNKLFLRCGRPFTLFR